MNKLTVVMPIQQQNPIKIGLPPVLISFIISVLSPIALMASTIKNLLKVFIGENMLEFAPSETETVVMTDAAIK